MTRFLQRTAFLLAMLLAVIPGQATAGKIGDFFKKKEKGKKEEVRERPTYVPSGKWEAFFRDGEGEEWPVAEPMEKNEDRDWLFLQYTEYPGPKSRLAIMWIENKAPDAMHSEVPVSAIEDLMTTAMHQTKRFHLVERKLIQAQLDEQNFGASGRVSSQTAAKAGLNLGADYQMFASVNEWTPRKSKGEGGWGAFGIGVSVAEVAMSFKVIDTVSSEVVFSETIRAEGDDRKLNFMVLGIPASLGGRSPVSYAVQSCINKAAYVIVSKLKQRTWRATVTDVKEDEGEVYLNAGSNMGVKPGTMLTCLSKGKDIVDPDTGHVLGVDTKAIGQVQVTTVKDEFSIAAITEGCAGLKPGDKVEMAAERDDTRKADAK